MPDPTTRAGGEGLAEIHAGLLLHIRETLAARRGDLGLSLQDVASAASITKAHVWEIETGRACNPSLKSLVGLAAALRMPVADLMGLADGTAGGARRRYTDAEPKTARTVAEEQAYGIIDPDYARIFTIARCLAWAEGYALMMHGSFTRDLDLLAVPWTERACEPAHLVRRVEAATDLRIITTEPGTKPHGRLAWTLVFPGFGDPRFVDFGVVPPVSPDPIPPIPAPAGQGQRGGEDA